MMPVVDTSCAGDVELEFVSMAAGGVPCLVRLLSVDLDGPGCGVAPDQGGGVEFEVCMVDGRPWPALLARMTRAETAEIENALQYELKRRREALYVD